MKIVRWAIAILRWLLLASTGFFAGIVGVGVAPVWFPGVLKGVFPWSVQNQWWLLPGPPVVAVVCQWLLTRLEARERDRQLRQLLHELLDRMRERFIRRQLQGEPSVHHRLTLFRANRKQTKLSIFARSGEATRDSKTCWRIDPNNQDRCEGVAGVGWFLDTMMFVPEADQDELPDVSGDVGDHVMEDYARRTFVRPEEVRKHRWRGRSFATITLRADGPRWGVLVFDSIDPKGANQRAIRATRFAADMLSDIIKAWRSGR